MSARKVIGLAVRARRYALGWSQPELADAAGYCVRALGRLERGEPGRSSESLLVDVAGALGTTVDALYAEGTALANLAAVGAVKRPVGVERASAVEV